MQKGKDLDKKKKRDNTNWNNKESSLRGLLLRRKERDLDKRKKRDNTNWNNKELSLKGLLLKRLKEND